MPINTTTITPASLKSKEVATEDYVDSAVSNVSIDDATWQTKVQQALDSNTTTIDGARITTGTIASNRIDSNIVNGKTIIGAKIYGAYIEGSIIRSSWIDDSMSGYLTYWAELTPAQVLADYSEYVGNFAKENGTLFVDPEGRARLQGYPIVYSVQSQTSGRVALGDTVALEISDHIMAYDSYQSNATNRVRSITSKLGSTEHILFRVSAGA